MAAHGQTYINSILVMSIIFTVTASVSPVPNGGSCVLHTDCENYNNGNGIICLNGTCQCIPDGASCILEFGIGDNECCSKSCLPSTTCKIVTPSPSLRPSYSPSNDLSSVPKPIEEGILYSLIL